jgi:hypothetical protein
MAALSVVVGLLVGLTLRGLRGPSERATVDPTNASTQPSSASRSSVAAPAVPSDRRDETPPWQATPQNTTTLPPGTVPAWQVNPPPPDPSAPIPPPPREPPNPAQHRPAMDNPGGVNGDRPERPAP